MEEPYTPIPNEMLHYLCKAKLGSAEIQSLFFTIRQTLGWKDDTGGRKAFNKIALKQFSDATGLDRRRVHEALQLLEARKIITIRHGADRQPLTYGLNMNFSQWHLSYADRTALKKHLRPQVVRPGADSLSGQPRTDLSALHAPSKEIEINKKNGKKAAASPDPSNGDGRSAQSPEERKKLLAEQARILKERERHESNLQPN